LRYRPRLFHKLPGAFTRPCLSQLAMCPEPPLFPPALRLMNSSSDLSLFLKLSHEAVSQASLPCTRGWPCCVHRASDLSTEYSVDSSLGSSSLPGASKFSDPPPPPPPGAARVYFWNSYPKPHPLPNCPFFIVANPGT
jgi:hypothetical protein